MLEGAARGHREEHDDHEHPNLRPIVGVEPDEATRDSQCHQHDGEH